VAIARIALSENDFSVQKKPQQLKDKSYRTKPAWQDAPRFSCGSRRRRKDVSKEDTACDGNEEPREKIKQIAAWVLSGSSYGAGFQPACGAGWKIRIH
jgi:hypothetical protein